MSDEHNAKVTIGLFGTCGASRWREKFIETYTNKGVQYYNPQVENWTPECAEEEAEHLANDEIILFPITSETYASGSLSEVGFSILNAIRLDDRREFVIMIAQTLDSQLNDEIARKESLRSRALVKQHLKKLRLRNVFLVDSLGDMLTVSIQLYEAAKVHKSLEHFNPHKK